MPFRVVQSLIHWIPSLSRLLGHVRPPSWFPLPRLGSYRITGRPAAEEQLGDVEHLHVFPSLRARHAVSHHVQTKRTGRREGLRAGRDRFLRTQDWRRVAPALRRTTSDRRPHRSRTSFFRSEAFRDTAGR